MDLKLNTHPDEMYQVVDATLAKLEDRAARAIANVIQKDWLDAGVIAAEVEAQAAKLAHEIERFRTACRLLDAQAKAKLRESQGGVDE